MIPEKEREALQRLTMCARHDCKICKYKDKYTFEDCDDEITENMHILFDALSLAKTKWYSIYQTKPYEEASE